MKPCMRRAAARFFLATAAALSLHSISFAQGKPAPPAALNAPKTEVTLQIPGTPSTKVILNAAQVETLINTLTQARAAMNPPRPMVPPAPGTQINVATDGRWYVQPDGEGVDLDVLHPGHGWVGVYLDRASIEQLNRALARYAHPVIVHRRPIRHERP